MKTLSLVILLVLGVTAISNANGYKIDDSDIDAAFNSSADVTYSIGAAKFLKSETTSVEPTKGGYLIRSYFCGFIGLHRSYMGTAGETMWWKYFCASFVAYGGIVNFVDFWGVVINGDEQLAKYKDNPKFVVWLN